MKKVTILTGASFLIWLILPRPPLDGVSYSRAVYDREGRLLRLTLSPDEKYRVRVSLNEVPKAWIDLVLLQEDKLFYYHFGCNPVALLRAGWSTFFQRTRMGGSTITMQVARLLYQFNTKSIAGKLRQVWIAFLLERHFSKTQILEAYFNLIPFGGNIEGIAAASLIFFGKNTDQVNLLEAMALSVIPQRPTERFPFRQDTKRVTDDLAAARRRLWKKWNAKNGSLWPREEDLNLPVHFKSLAELPFRAPHFCDWVLRDSVGAIRLHTTLDFRLQGLVEKRLVGFIENKRRQGVSNAAALLLHFPSMEMKVMVGSANFFDPRIFGQVNGTVAKRSPGSTLKPLLYGLAFDQGIIHPNSILKDAPMQFSDFDPENFDHDFLGPVMAKDALIRSRNVPAVYLSSKLSDPTLYQWLGQAGIKFPKDERYYGLALVLGGVEVSMLELVRLYSLLGNGGAIREVKHLVGQPTEAGRPALTAEASYLVTGILENNPRPSMEGLSRIAAAKSVAWKTGTSFGFRDAWTVGVFGPYVLAVWLGNFDGSPSPGLIGRDTAAPLFFDIAEAIQASDGAPAPPVRFPEGLTRVKVCSVSGKLPGKYCRSTSSTWFIAGKSPIDSCDIHRPVWIETHSKKRTCHPDFLAAREEIFEFWPSDLLKLFRMAGIPRRVPPPESPECALGKALALGKNPEILSPKSALTYQLRGSDPDSYRVPFLAAADADAKELYWFLDEEFLGKAHPQDPFLWKARPGRHVVRVQDNLGRASATIVRVKVGE